MAIANAHAAKLVGNHNLRSGFFKRSITLVSHFQKDEIRTGPFRANEKANFETAIIAQWLVCRIGVGKAIATICAATFSRRSRQFVRKIVGFARLRNAAMAACDRPHESGL
jgi:hypothetical protein